VSASGLSTRPARPDDVDELGDLKLLALRVDLERAGVWRPDHNRARFVREFVPEETTVVLDDADRLVGCLAVHPAGDTTWLRHFYLREEARGRGIGTRLLTQALATVSTGSVTLDVLTGSRVESLYRRFGFHHVSDDGVDTIMRLDLRA
jgi:GNAT superfamily N-acetyltransferase